jgi:hypothetical protein
LKGDLSPRDLEKIEKPSFFSSNIGPIEAIMPRMNFIIHQLGRESEKYSTLSLIQSQVVAIACGNIRDLVACR